MSRGAPPLGASHNHRSGSIVMNPAYIEEMRSVVNLAIPGSKTVTFEDGSDGGFMILIEWPAYQLLSPSIAIQLLEDTVQSYGQCSAYVRAYANLRLLKYLRSQVGVQKELPKSDAWSRPPRLEWTILYSHMFGDKAKEPFLKRRDDPPHQPTRNNSPSQQAIPE